jgi:protein TonB
MIRRGAPLRDESLAAIVLDVRRERVPAKLRARQGNSLAGESLAAIVLGSRVRSTHRRMGAALTTTLVLYGCLGALVLTRARRGNEVRPSSSPPLEVEHVVDLQPPEPPEPGQRPAQPAPAPHVPTIAAPKARAARETNEPPPAEAGRVAAAQPAASPAIDFMGFDVSTGRGQRYTGGVTASSGSYTRAGSGPSGAQGKGQTQSGGVSRARPVGAPRNGDWGCPWPPEAAGLALDEQIVVLRAVVRADGSVASVSLTSDPGFGFGPVAIACARRQQFAPATDERGAPILATSPPIRFRFTRQ